VFRGSAQLNLDNKGRLVVPARYHAVLRERCGGHLVITGDVDRCLLVYPLPEWELIQQKLESLSNLDPRVRALQRRLIGFAVDTEMDAAGRVLVSPELRRYAQLDKAVVLAGMGKKFELWNQEQWESRSEPLGESPLAELEGFSL
jgi:MraZ protein